MYVNGRSRACAACRRRKVKCDNAQPTCSKCIRNGEECIYSPPNKQNRNSVSIPLELIDDQLFKTEVAFALHQSSLSPLQNYAEALQNTEPYSWTNTDNIDATFDNPSAELSNACLASKSLQDGDVPLKTFEAEYSEPCFASQTPQLDSTFTDLSGLPQGFDHVDDINVPCPIFSGRKDSADNWPVDTWDFSETSSSTSFSGTSSALEKDELVENVSQEVMKNLFDCYFKTTHISFPIVNRTAFFSKVEAYASDLTFTGLRNAICAHAARSSQLFRNLADGFYKRARKSLELTEVGESKNLASISALQTNILIALYEIQETSFTRAWVSISRATWLARMLGIHRMDRSGTSKAADNSMGATNSPSDPFEIEEKRRTFWAALHLNCFLSVGMDWSPGLPIDFSEITTFLPTEDAKVPDMSAPRFTLGQALTLSVRNILTPGHGVLITASICLRVLTHINQVHRDNTLDLPNYDFWAHHHSLSEANEHASNISLAHLKPSVYIKNPTILFVSMVSEATTICLHQAVICRIRKTNGPANLAAESSAKCLGAAMRIVDVTRFVNQKDFAQMNPFVFWTLYIAIQALIRQGAAADNTPRPKSSNSSRTQLSSPISNSFVGSSSSPGGLASNERKSIYANVPGNQSQTASFQATGSNSCAPMAARLLDARHLLQTALAVAKSTNPLAGIFESQIKEELEAESETVFDGRIVGLARFDLFLAGH